MFTKMLGLFKGSQSNGTVVEEVPRTPSLHEQEAQPLSLLHAPAKDANYHPQELALAMAPSNDFTNIALGENNNANNEKNGPNANGKIELKPEDVADQLPFAYSRAKKWSILTVVFLVQVSMNANTTLYASGIPGIAKEFNVTEDAARWAAASFLIAYAFGCELWAPWSEEYGRKVILSSSLLCVNLCALLVGWAKNYGMVMAGRTLGGLCTAGGSVTLAIVTDMFKHDDYEYQLATSYVVFSSVGGSIIGPIFGGWLEENFAWQWTTWVQVIFGAVVMILHFFTVPETRTTSVINGIAKKMREEDPACQKYGPGEMSEEKRTWSDIGQIWARPFKMLVTEPIVFWLSTLSGFSDALIFIQVAAFGLIYSQWGLSPFQIGLCFLPLFAGYLIAWFLYLPFYHITFGWREKYPTNQKYQYEQRLWPLLVLAPCLPLGLGIMAATSGGPDMWIGYSMIASVLIGIANFAVYNSTIDYMVRAYGAEYSASATGGNGWCRDVFAGILTVPAVYLYTTIEAEKHRNYMWASIILLGISLLLGIAVFVIYFKGPSMRKRSKYAEAPEE